MPTAPRPSAARLERLRSTLAERGRQPLLHVAAGLALAGAAVLAANLAARRESALALKQSRQGVAEPDRATRPPPALFGLVWPPIFLALTASGLRIWNAPPSRQRSRALTLWGLALAFNALWMALGPRRFGGRVTTAIASLGASGAYAWEAHRMYAPPETMAAGPQSWRGFAGALGDRLRRRRAASGHTLH